MAAAAQRHVIATPVGSMNSRLLELIGAIVLSTQDAERYLKAILPFTDSQDPSISGAMSRHEKIKKRTLGDLVGKLVDSSTSTSAGLEQHLADLVERRNQIVHHFHETYGEQLRSGHSQQVAVSLEALLSDVDTLRRALEQMALQLFEAVRDITFVGTPEYQKMDELLASIRRRVTR